uniref:Uncharacterized protein n=1 Tax=Anguilla anguilla TaxID=7936 RepID=A0A0E9PC82_ANGAN
MIFFLYLGKNNTLSSIFFTRIAEKRELPEPALYRLFDLCFSPSDDDAQPRCNPVLFYVHQTII